MWQYLADFNAIMRMTKLLGIYIHDGQGIRKFGWNLEELRPSAFRREGMDERSKETDLTCDA